MNTGEQNLWTRLNKIMTKYATTNWHANRIETGATVLGQPDVNYCLFGVENNIELKYVDAPTSRCILRPSQYQWMNKRAKAGNRCWIIAYCKEQDTTCIISSVHAKKLLVDPSWSNWFKLSTRWWCGEVNPNELSDILENK